MSHNVETIFIFIVMLIIRGSCFGQEIRPVQWQFSTERNNSKSNGEVILKIKAYMADGWHLYSQDLKEGGPIPTKIIFNSDGEYILVGKTEEAGRAVRLYDSVYEMEITWYSGSVLFFQRLLPGEQTRLIEGDIEYMVCNDHMCISLEEHFKMDVLPK